MGKVDIIIAARNAAATVVRSVSSALQQELTARVYVIDDASTDTTVKTVREGFPSEPRLELWELPANLGPAAARNLALAKSTSPWISVLDADDFFLPGRLSLLLAESSDCDFVADDLQISRDDGLTWSPARIASKGQIDFTTFALGNVSQPGQIRRELGFLKPLMRRQFLEQAQLSFDEALRLGEDYVLYARALAAGCRFKMTSGAAYVAVERAESLSGHHSTADLACFHEALQRLEQDFRLTLRDRRAAFEHRRSVRRRLDHRRALDAKAAGDYATLARVLAKPDSALYIIKDVYRTARSSKSQ